MADGFHQQLQRDSAFLCSGQWVDTELLDKLVLQLNRIYPQILNDRQAQKFRNLSVPAAMRLAELLAHLQGRGEEACHEFYRALHIHAEEVYRSLPTRVCRREASDLSGPNPATSHTERYVLNDRGPLFFLSCFSVAVGLALLYYNREGKAGSGLGFTVLGLGRQAGEVLVTTYSDDGTKKK